jgi:hypothetical protein
VNASHALNEGMAFIDQAHGFKERASLYQKMCDGYKDRMAYYLRGILIWICHIVPVVCLKEEQGPQFWISPSDVNPAAHRLSNRRCRLVLVDSEELPHSRRLKVKDANDPPGGPQNRKMRLQKWYCAIILWYLIKEMFKLVEDDLEIRNLCWSALETLGAMDNNDNATGTLLADDAYRCMLRWYHSHSIVEIYGALSGMDAKSSNSEWLQIDVHTHRSLKKHWQGRAEKAIRSFGQGRLARQCIGHEDANLAMFGIEIGIMKFSLSEKGLSVLDYIKILVAKRTNTEKVNSGASKIKRWEVRDTRSALPRPAPWELSCLGHHLPINLCVSSNREECMDSCKKFLLADWTFIPSWDYSRAVAASLWWDLTTSSIICTQLLVDCLRHTKRRNNSCEDIMKGPLEIIAEPESTAGEEQIIRLSTGQEKRLHEKLEKVLDVLELSKPKLLDENEGFTWKKRCPGMLFHPDTSVQSLQDTPQVFGLKQARNIQIRSNIKAFLRKNYLARLTDYSLGNIRSLIPARKLFHISCVDFSLAVTDSDMPEVGISLIRGRMDQGWLKHCLHGPRVLKLLGQKHELWDFYFLDPKIEHRCFAKFKDPDKQFLKEARSEVLRAYGDSLLNVFNDSVSRHWCSTG